MDNPTVNNARSTFRIVERWNPNQAYLALSTAQNNQINNAGTRFHCYTMDAAGRMTFWIALANNTNIDPLEDDGTNWQRVEFVCRENIIITEIDGVLRIWDRVVSYSPNSPPIGAPTMANTNEWRLRDLGTVTQRYVYTTAYTGIITLWDKSNGLGTMAIPGVGNTWSRLDYDTGIEYVYTENAAGVKTFWHSPQRSSLYPGRGTAMANPSNAADTVEWKLLYEQVFTELSFVLRVDTLGQMVYFDTTGEYGWFEIICAWIGNESGTLTYHWSETNFYVNGDIVVYGTTETNVYRHFILDIPAGQTMVGGRPMSDSAWREIRI
jgi:hypothetical protein